MEKFIITLGQLAFRAVECTVIVIGTFTAHMMGKQDAWREIMDAYIRGKRRGWAQAAERERLEAERQAMEAQQRAIQAAHRRHGIGHAIMHKAGEEVVGHVLKHILK